MLFGKKPAILLVVGFLTFSSHRSSFELPLSWTGDLPIFNCVPSQLLLGRCFQVENKGCYCPGHPLSKTLSRAAEGRSGFAGLSPPEQVGGPGSDPAWDLLGGSQDDVEGQLGAAVEESAVSIKAVP